MRTTALQGAGFGNRLLSTLCLILLSACGGGGTSQTSGPPAAPQIVEQPAAVSISDGETATFNVSATGPAPISYQWQLNGSPIAGATTSSYTTPAMPFTASGDVFTVQVSGPGGTVTSSAATLTVKALVPSIDVQPLSVSVAYGGAATFSVHATGTGPLGYQWMRGATAIAGATTSSLTVSPVAFGDDSATYTVVVSNPGGATTSHPAALSVVPTGNVTTISACQEITTSGAYQLQADLVAGASSACISVHDVSHVQIDCAGHTIADDGVNGQRSLTILTVSDLSVKNCVLKTSWLNISQTSSASLSGNTIAAPDGLSTAVVNADHVTGLNFSANTVTGTVQQLYGVEGIIAGNRVTARPGSGGVVAGLIVSNYGVRTQIFANQLDGSWNGVQGMNGADDGVVLSDETDPQVLGNAIQNVFDCGIETVGVVTGAVLSDNRIQNAGFCGVGGWYWSSLVGATVSRNVVDNAWTLLNFVRVYGLRPAGFDLAHQMPADVAIAFKDNVFDGNVLLNRPVAAPGTSPLTPVTAFLPVYDDMQYTMGTVSSIPGEIGATPSDFQIANNVLKNNVFGKSGDAPYFGGGPYWPNSIVDGGGNVCSQPSATSFPNFPLRCN